MNYNILAQYANEADRTLLKDAAVQERVISMIERISGMAPSYSVARDLCLQHVGVLVHAVPEDLLRHATFRAKAPTRRTITREPTETDRLSWRMKESQLRASPFPDRNLDYYNRRKHRGSGEPLLAWGFHWIK